MNTVYIIKAKDKVKDYIYSRTNPASWDCLQGEENITELLMSYFPAGLPQHVRIYHGDIALSNDVTPRKKHIEQDIERLNTLAGTFHVVEYPGGSVVAIIVAVVISAAALAASFLLAKKAAVPNAASRGNSQSQSSNNELSSRVNNARPMERIPDIYGELRATPDLLNVSWLTFVNNQEIEHTLLCLGRGAYTIYDIRDGETPISEILGTSVEVYNPNIDIFKEQPFYRLGQAINNENMVIATRSNSVNGQTLHAPNSGNYSGTIYFIYPNIMQLTRTVEDSFGVGDRISLVNATFTSEGIDFNLDGSYRIQSIFANQIVVDNPSAVSADWELLTELPDEKSPAVAAKFSQTSINWIGPFIFDIPDLTRISANVIALSGLYKDDGTDQVAFDVEIQMKIEPLNAKLEFIGNSEVVNFWVYGSADSKDLRASTIDYTFNSFTGRCQISMRRITEKDLKYKGSVVDEIKWRDLYAIKEFENGEFGNVTTVKLRQTATAGALALKERKLNMLVCRNLPKRIETNQFTEELYPTKNVADILSAVSLDPFIGKRPKSQLDFDNIYKTINEVITYFGTEKAAEFSYTIDAKEITYEETVAMIANAAFCRAYLRGSQLKLTFEKETNLSSLMFNHRNKMPGSEIRTINCGPTDNRDGVIFEYISPRDDALVSIYIPEDRSYTEPQTYESAGIRSKEQAYLHAWRYFNKLKYQRISVEFDATDEANLLLLGDRVLVSDNTLSTTQDGEVEGQKGLTIYTSQNVVFDIGKTYYIFLQLSDKSIQSIRVFPGIEPNSVELMIPPRLPLIYGKSQFASTPYIITADIDKDAEAFLVTETEPNNDNTITLRCMNYSTKYYQNDKDYINGLIRGE